MDLQSIAKRRAPYYTVGPHPYCDWITDGVADDVQIQQAIDYLDACGGGRIQLTADTYVLANQIRVKEDVHIEGITIPYRDRIILADHQISQFNITNAIDNAFVMVASSGIERCGFYYPNQQTNAAPDVYPATIKLVNSPSTMIPKDVYIAENLAINPYIFCDATVAHERLSFMRNLGSPISVGLDLDHSSDIDYIEGNHWNPNFAPHILGINIYNWMIANSIGFRVGRADGAKFLNNFTWGYYQGAKFLGTDMITISSNAFDATPRCIDCVNLTNSRISNNLCYAFDAFNSALPANAVGISLEMSAGGGANNIVSGNTVVSAATGIYSNCPKTVIVGNNVVGFDSICGYNKGIWCYTSAPRCVISNNFVDGVGHANGGGIVVEATQFVMSGNLIYNCPSSGFFIVNGLDDYTIVGNVTKTCGGNQYGNGAHKFADTSHNVAD